MLVKANSSPTPSSKFILLVAQFLYWAEPCVHSPQPHAGLASSGWLYTFYYLREGCLHNLMTHWYSCISKTKVILRSPLSWDKFGFLYDNWWSYFMFCPEVIIFFPHLLWALFHHGGVLVGHIPPFGSDQHSTIAGVTSERNPYNIWMTSPLPVQGEGESIYVSGKIIIYKLSIWVHVSFMCAIRFLR